MEEEQSIKCRLSFSSHGCPVSGMAHDTDPGKVWVVHAFQSICGTADTNDTLKLWDHGIRNKPMAHPISGTQLEVGD